MRHARKSEEVDIFPGLDPKFVWVVSRLWKSARYLTFSISLLFRKIIALVKGKEFSDIGTEPQLNEAVHQTKTVKQKLKLTDERAFLHVGSTRWVSELTPKVIKINSREESPEAEMLEISYLNGKDFKKFEVGVFGEIYEEQLETIEKVLEGLVKELKIESLGLREIHIVKDLGKFLNQDGVPDVSVPAFTIDHSGSMLLNEAASLNPKLCAALLRYAVQDFQNYHVSLKKGHETLWNMASSIQERLKKNPDYSLPGTKYLFGSLRGRFVIDQNTKVIGGVFLGYPAREAITVEEEGPILSSAYSELLTDLRRKKEALGIGFEEYILKFICKLVQRLMPRSTPEALKAMRDSCRISADEELSLETCLKHETGDADHQALFAAYLLERLNKEHEHYLAGKVSVERNWLPGGGHVWLRYTHSPSDVYILDPKKNYVGRLDDYSFPRWPYERASDLKAVRYPRPIR